MAHQMAAAYFVLHLRKTGVAQLAALVHYKRLQPLVECSPYGVNGQACRLSPCHVVPRSEEAPCNVVGSESAQAEITLSPGVKLLTMVREPAAHVLSQYAHCQGEGAQGQLLHHWPPISLEAWLELILEQPGNLTFCAPSPLDQQTAQLGRIRMATSKGVRAPSSVSGEGALGTASRVLDAAYWVGVTGSFDASICLLLSQLRGQRACTCDEPHTASPRAAEKHGTAPEEVPLTGRAREALQRLTRTDTVIFARGMARLYAGLLHYNLSCLLERD